MAKPESKKDISAADKREWKIGSTIIIACFALLLWFIISCLYVGSPKEITTLANQLDPGLGWTLKHEMIKPPSNPCFLDHCPSVYRSWSSPRELDREQFEKIAQLGSHKLSILEDCFEQTETGHIRQSCAATSTIDGYYVGLSYYGFLSDSEPSLQLSIYGDMGPLIMPFVDFWEI